jgi:hypothetical protein
VATQVLSFELPSTDAPPQGWNLTPPSTVFSDANQVHSGYGSVRIAVADQTVSKYISDPLRRDRTHDGP